MKDNNWIWKDVKLEKQQFQLIRFKILKIIINGEIVSRMKHFQVRLGTSADLRPRVDVWPVSSKRVSFLIFQLCVFGIGSFTASKKLLVMQDKKSERVVQEFF